MEKRKYVPRVIEDELRAIWMDFWDHITDEELGAMGEDGVKKSYDQWLEAHASPLLKLYREYDRFTGDEGQLLDRDGTYLHGADGRWIQNWTADAQGFCYDRYTGEPIMYSDGTPVQEREMPEELRLLYDEDDP